MNRRVVGFDIARAFAIFGMIIVNFKVVMNDGSGNAFLLGFASLFEGRASALFVVLAGVGVTFLTNKARRSQDNAAIIGARKMLLKRGLLLIVVGLAYTPIWPADILHFYGFYFLVAAALFHIGDKKLLLVAAVIMGLFPLLMIFFDYEYGWDWATLTYQNFWTLDGMIRHILFNGFHPVVPWCAFLFLGMWLGRQNLSEPVTRKKILFSSLGIWLTTEFTVFVLRTIISEGADIGITPEEVTFLFSTSIIPPLPQYIIAAGSLAVVIVIACLHFSERFTEIRLTRWLYQTGQLSLTLYVAHVIIGLGVLEAIGRLENQTIGFAVSSAFVFCTLCILYSVVWLKFYKTGPLEWLFRKLAS